jgi:hypothetical protein
MTTLMSSTKMTGKEYLSGVNGRSLLYIRNNNGPRIEP